MSEVQRWSWADAHDGGMWEYDAGEYVKASDYDALALKTAELEKDAARYKIARQFITPRYLSNALNIKWKDVPAEQSIEEKIDELCDAAARD